MSDSGTFGSFGGRYVPEPLQEPLAELADAFDAAIESEEFREELDFLLEHYGGRPTPVFHAVVFE